MIDKAIIISGFDRTGKSTTAKYLNRKGFFTLECGEYIKHFIPPMSSISTSEFYNSDIEKLNDQIIEYALSLNNKKIIFVGVRSIDLLRKIQKISKYAIIIYISSNVTERYNRHLKEIKNSNIKTLHDFMDNDSIQLSWGINQIECKADYKINNDTSLESLNEIMTEVNL